MRTITLAALLGLTVPAVAEPIPLPKTGVCPDGYASGAAYCMPIRRDARVAVPRVGPCPSGFRESGGYCVDMKRPSIGLDEHARGERAPHAPDYPLLTRYPAVRGPSGFNALIIQFDHGIAHAFGVNTPLGAGCRPISGS